MTQEQIQQNDPGLSSHYIGGIGDWLRYHAWYRPDTEALVYNDDRGPGCSAVVFLPLCF